MQATLIRQSATPKEPTAEEAMVFVDPWEVLEEERERHNGWMLSYIDILTLLLTLFVVLLVLQPKNEAPPVVVDPGEFRFVSPEPIERQAASYVRAQLWREDESIDAPLDLPSTTDNAAHADTNPDSFRPFSNWAVLPPPHNPLIYLPTAENPSSADANLPPNAAVSDNAVSAVAVDASRMAEPDTTARPAAKSSSRDQLRRFITRLSQQHLDNRVRVSEVAEGVYLEVSNNILFALGSTELKRNGAALLDELAQLLSEQKGIVSVEGHTDDRPIANTRFPSNWELSSGRATTVTRYLIGKGLDPARLRAVGYADTRPLESNDTIEGRARNRRVALIVEIPEA